MDVTPTTADWVLTQFRARLGDNYVYGGVYSPTDISQGCDCSGLVGWVLEALVNGPAAMNWGHVVSTESWPYDYSTDTPAAPGTVGPYGTVSVGGDPSALPAEAALWVNIMHGGGGEDSHMNAILSGTILESNGDDGSCTNGTGGVDQFHPEWTDHWYLPGSGGPVPPAPSPSPVTYTVKAGDSLGWIAARFDVSLADLEAANPQITDPNVIYPGQVLRIP